MAHELGPSENILGSLGLVDIMAGNVADYEGIKGPVTDVRPNIDGIKDSLNHELGEGVPVAASGEQIRKMADSSFLPFSRKKLSNNSKSCSKQAR